MATRDAVRAELVRSRGFIRGAETQLSKALAALDALEGEAPVTPEPEVPTNPEPEVPEQPSEPAPVLAVRLSGRVLEWDAYPGASGYRISFRPAAGGEQTDVLSATTRELTIPDGSPAGRITVTVVLSSGDGPSASVDWTPPVVVEPEPPEPPVTPEPPVVLPPSGATPLINERFPYSSVAQMLASPLYNHDEDQRTDRMALDTSVRFEGHPTLRYDYPGGRALEYTITRQLRVPAGTREVWVEAFVRFQPGFTFDTGGGMKLLHVNVNPDGVGRFGLNIENGNGGTINAEGPVDNYDAFYLRGPSSSPFRSGGNWHRLRYHVVLGAQKSHEFWLGDSYVGSRTASTRANEVWGVSLARNMNRTGDSPMSLWWGEVRVWTTNPGW